MDAVHVFGIDWGKYSAFANMLSGAGGALGGLAAVVALPAVLFTWQITRKTAYRTKVYSVMAEMLSAHRDIVASMKMGDLEGRAVFAAMLREFNRIYRIVAEVGGANKQQWSTSDKVDIAYTFLFFGPTYTCWGELESYDRDSVMKISSEVSRLKSKHVNDKLYIGHQNRLSNYFRNLYSSFEFLDRTKLDIDEKVMLGKLFRTQMTNYEQALFAYNSLSHFGSPWITSGLMGKFKLVKNIPRLFSELDNKTTFKDLFPYIDFEWEQHGKARLQARTFKIFGFTVYVHRTTKTT